MQVLLEAVGNVEHRVSGAREFEALRGPQRGTKESPFAKGRTGSAERSGDDDQIARLRSAPAGDPLRAPQCGHAEVDTFGGRRVAAQHRDAGLAQPLVELENVGKLRVFRQTEADDKTIRFGPGGRQVADVDGGSAIAEVAPGNPVEAEENTFPKCG